MDWKKSFKKFAKQKLPDEACGLVAIIKKKETFWPCKNLAKSSDSFFVLDPDDWADCEDMGEIIGVVHSHPTGPATASEVDKKSCEHIGFPYFIYSIEYDNWSCTNPIDWVEPKLERSV